MAVEALAPDRPAPSTSSGVRRVTGIAFGWMAPTSLFGSQVRKAKRSFAVSPSFTFLTNFQPRQWMPAKKASGGVSSKANQTYGREPSGWGSGSAKLVNGTTHRFSVPSRRRQCDEATLRTLVTPGSRFLPFRTEGGDGMPQRAITSSRPSVLFHTIGAGLTKVAGLS